MAMFTRARKQARPLFTAITAASAAVASSRERRGGARAMRDRAAVDIIATFVGVLARLDAGRAANQRGEA